MVGMLGQLCEKRREVLDILRVTEAHPAARLALRGAQRALARLRVLRRLYVTLVAHL
jgi:hypothetical protein